MVRAKFCVVAVNAVPWSEDAKEIVLEPRYDPTLPEDQKYSKYTPSGRITMVVDNPPAAAQLPLGKILFVDFTPAEPEAPAAAELAAELNAMKPAEPSALPQGDGAGFGRVGAILAVGLLALAALCAPAFAQEPSPTPPPCGTAEKPEACVSLTAGVVTVVTRDARREYAAGGALFEGPFHGFQTSASVLAFGVQDGASAELGADRSFRAVKAEASAGKSAGNYTISLRGSVTYSIEGGIGAPLDPRMFEAQVDARLRLDGDGYLAGSVGYDGAVGGWGAKASINIPIPNAPSIVAQYELPFTRDPRGGLPWVVTAGAQVRLKSFRLGK